MAMAATDRGRQRKYKNLDKNNVSKVFRSLLVIPVSFQSTGFTPCSSLCTRMF